MTETLLDAGDQPAAEGEAARLLLYQSLERVLAGYRFNMSVYQDCVDAVLDYVDGGGKTLKYQLVAGEVAMPADEFSGFSSAVQGHFQRMDQARNLRIKSRSGTIQAALYITPR